MCGLFDIEIFFYVLFTNSGATYFYVLNCLLFLAYFGPKNLLDITKQSILFA